MSSISIDHAPNPNQPLFQSDAAGQDLAQASAIPWKSVFQVFLVSRILIWIGFLGASHRYVVALAKYLYRFLMNSPDPAGSVFAAHPFFYDPQHHSLYELVKFWDGFWYLKLAMQGYSYNGTYLHQTIAHYPFFSLMSAVFAKIPMLLGVGREPAIVWTGALLSNALFVLSLGLLYFIVNKYHGKRIAMRTLWLMALYPASLSCSMFLSESTFLAFSLGFFAAMECDCPWFAAFLSWPASLTRLNGALLPIAAAQMAGVRKMMKPKYWAVIGIILAGIALFPLYLGYKFGNPWLYFKLHSAYRGNARMDKLLLYLVIFSAAAAMGYYWPKLKAEVAANPQSKARRQIEAITVLIGGSLAAYLIISGWNLLSTDGTFSQVQQWIPFQHAPGMMAMIAATIILGYGHRVLPMAYKTYTAFNLFSLIWAASFLSDQRYLLVVFPLFWALAKHLPESPRAFGTICASMAVVLVFYSVLYNSMAWLFLF